MRRSWIASQIRIVRRAAKMEIKINEVPQVNPIPCCRLIEWLCLTCKAHNNKFANPHGITECCSSGHSSSVYIEHVCVRSTHYANLRIFKIILHIFERVSLLAPLSCAIYNIAKMPLLWLDRLPCRAHG